LLGLALIVGALSSGAAMAFAAETKGLVRGGGSTFAAPLFAAWIDSYEAAVPSFDFEYDAIGSGEGIDRFLTGSLDFAASDAPLTPAQAAIAAGKVRQVPVTAGMIAIAYNLPGQIEGRLQLPRDVIGSIFSGEIETWADPRLTAANPGLQLPNSTIQVVARLDSSGTTYSFTNYLEAISATWQATGNGVAKLVDWPGSASLGRGNEGVAVKIQRGEGTIGYVEYGFASRLGLPLAAVENAAGHFVVPAPEAGAVAINAAEIPPDLVIEDPDPQGPGAYSIVAVTWMLLAMPTAPDAKAAAIGTFADWALTEGQAAAPDLGYVPLPEKLRERARAALTAAYEG
jgi:phosphate transport system substrate-binding protein